MRTEKEVPALVALAAALLREASLQASTDSLSDELLEVSKELRSSLNYDYAASHPNLRSARLMAAAQDAAFALALPETLRLALEES